MPLDAVVVPLASQLLPAALTETAAPSFIVCVVDVFIHPLSVPHGHVSPTTTHALYVFWSTQTQ